ncbi:MAG: apolipoprotein N-acyltransferase [Aestuariivirga sp.]
MAQASRPARAVLALAAGAATALGLPPLGLWPLAFLGVPLILLLLETAKDRGWRSGAGTGWLFGLGYFAVAFHWIGFAFLVDAATYLWMMPFMLGALAGGMALYWGLAALVAKRLGGGGLALALSFAAAIATAEWLRGHLFTGFPWAAPGLLADGMGGLAQGASLIGMTGLTLLILLWAALPYALASERSTPSRAAAVALALVLPALWIWGEMRLAAAPAAMVPGVQLRIVQPSVPQEQKWREDNARAIFEELKELSAMPTPEQPAGIGGITHVIWPESAVPFLIDESPAARSELAPLLGGRTALITGALRRGQGDAAEPDIYNSVIVFDGRAEPVARYDKWRLVPGGEFLPFAWALEPLGFRRVVTTPGNFTAGPGPRTIALPGGLPAQLLVCYEVIFPDRLVDEADRPGLIVNVTNDGWFGRSTGPHQHLAQARLRAIEQGIPIVRAANTGISAVIDSHGRYLQRLGLMQRGVIDSSLPAAISTTTYSWWGDSALLLLVAASLACVIVIHLLRRG